MHDAFISYARADSKQFVARLARALEAAGKDVWVDLDDIPPASRWREALQEGVLDSGAFVYVISPAAIASEHCRTELEHAAERNKRIIPVAHLEVPDAEIPAAVASLNWIPQDGVFEDDFERSVGRLIEAIETDQAAVRSHTRWQERAEGWAGLDRDRSLLARGSELAEAETWLTAQTGREPQPTALQAEWVSASRQTSSRRQGLVLGASLIALLVTAVLGVLALAQRNEAVEQRDTARAGELATDAIGHLEVDPELSLILALEAVRTDRNERTEHALERALLASRVRVRLDPEGEEALGTVVPSADGRLAATAGDDGLTTVWDAASGEALAELDPGDGAGAVLDVAFAPDGARVVSAHEDGAVRVWRVDGGPPLEEIQLAEQLATTVAVSPDGKRLAAGADDGTAAVFGLDGSGRVELGGMRKRVYSIEFGSDRAVLTASGDELARVWDAADGASVLTLRGHGGPQLDAKPSPDGSMIATANRDGSVVLWSVATGEPIGEPVVPPNRAAFVSRVAFVPGANTLLTSGAGGFVEAWDLNSRERVATYRGHQGFVLDVATSSDGNRVLTAGADGTARIWDFSQRRFGVEGQSYANSLDFNSDGGELVFADGHAEVLATETGERIATVDSPAPTQAAFFSPDDSSLSLAGADGRVRFFDLDGGELAGPTLDPGGGSFLFAADWSTDATRMLTASFELPAKVYDPGSGELVRTLPKLGFTFDAAISPDGAEAAIVAGDHSVPIFDVESGERLRELEGHRDRLNQVAYSADGSSMITGSDDGTARVWDAHTGAEQAIISHDGQPVRAVAISEDGDRVATATAGGELRIWDTDSQIELMRVTGADTALAFAPGGELIAGALTQASPRSTISVWECDVCVADAGELEALAERRITREPTARERERYLDR
jgi:WD40 repeat protein